VTLSDAPSEHRGGVGLRPALPLRIGSRAILGVDELADVGVDNRVHGIRAACLLRGPGGRRCR
jgi:hypothetical protein